MVNQFALTFDIDWAPDFVLEDLYHLLLEYQVKATWMVTHPTPWLDRFREHPDLFELGIHPNFLSGSSHGDTPEEVLNYVLDLVPEAVSSRSHAVVQSGPILNLLTNDSPVLVDSTVFLPEWPNIKPFRHLSLNGSLLRIPFFWADDFEMCRDHSSWKLDRYQEVPGWKIMMFHPIHAYLNTDDFGRYEGMKQALGPLNKATAEQVLSYRNQGEGARSMLLEVLAAMQQQGGGHHLKDFISLSNDD